MGKYFLIGFLKREFIIWIFEGECILLDMLKDILKISWLFGYEMIFSKMVQILIIFFIKNKLWQWFIRLTGKWKFQSKKRLREIFQNLIQGILATHSWVNWIASSVFCTNWVKTKNFLVSLASRAFLFVFSTSPSLKIAIFTPKTSIFIFNLHSISKKRYGVSLIFTLLQV